MSEPSSIAEAAEFALRELKQARPVTFLIAWETQSAVVVRTWPPSAAVLNGLLQILCEPDEPEDDGE